MDLTNPLYLVVALQDLFLEFAWALFEDGEELLGELLELLHGGVGINVRKPGLALQQFYVVEVLLYVVIGLISQHLRQKTRRNLSNPVIRSPTEIQFLKRRRAKLRKNVQKFGRRRTTLSKNAQKFGAATHTTKWTTGGDMYDWWSKIVNSSTKIGPI